MATATPTAPTSATAETPKVLKKAGPSDGKVPTTPTQTVFGCPHVKGLLTKARERAVDGYGKAMKALQREGNVADRFVKKPGGTVARSEVTYLCLQCPNVTDARERHQENHGFSIESTNGFLYCHECKDFVYDPTFEEIRSANSKKRKQTWASPEGDRKLVTTNAGATPCAATGLRGLYNMGQTCFMSVVLQSLIHNPFIRTFYLSEGHRATDCERDACTSCALDDIFTDFYGAEKHEGYGAVHMLQGCWKGGGGLAGYSQQDAHEYLGFILNSLHEAITDDEDKPSQRKDDRDCGCVIHQTFWGTMKSTVTCKTCGNTTAKVDPFMDLSLDVRNGPVGVKKKKLGHINGTQTVKEALPMDLAECLDRFTSPETLGGDTYHCRKCDTTRVATKKLILTQLPPVVPVHLKRFSHTKANAQSNKVDTRVRFPFVLDMTPYLAPTPPTATKAGAPGAGEKGEKKTPTKKAAPAPEPDADADADADADGEEDDDTINVKTPSKKAGAADDGGGAAAEPQYPIYELSSVVVHRGKIDTGHYISYSKQDGLWFRFDDQMVVQVDEREVLNAEAYMLFYVVREF